MRDVTDLFHAIMCEIWAILPSHGHAMVESIIPKLLAKDWEIFAKRPTENYFTGEPITGMTINGDCAVIPIKGRIMKDVPTVFKSVFSIADIRDVQDELEICQTKNRTGEVNRIALDIDSPGGLASASDELAADLVNVRKEMPVLSHFQNMGCSAAYEIAAPSQMVTCNENAQVGNIGSLMIFEDDSKRLEQMGIKREVFASGKFKGMGAGPLTDEQRQFLTDQTASYAERFKNFVRKYRTNVVEDDLEGQWFHGTKAVEHGLVHSNQRNLNTAIASFRNVVPA